MDKFRRILSAVSSIVKAKFFNKKMPIFIGWELTNRCNLKCKYCDAWRTESVELPTKTIFSMIDELKSLGTGFISFTGGEPLLREDLGEIIDYCKDNSMHTSVNSNGFELKQKFSSIKNTDLVIMSLDGSRKVHDYVRGEGSYERVLEAAETIKNAGIELNFAVTLTKFNLDQVDFLINKAREYDATMTFQPALLNVLYADRCNPTCPSEEENRKVFQQIIDYKKKLEKCIITNSFTALKHLYHWPNKRIIRCASGYITCRIKSNADICLCNPTYNKMSSYNSLKMGLKEAFYSLPKTYCDECWCAQRMEMNFLFDLRWEAIFNNLGLLTKR